MPDFSPKLTPSAVAVFVVLMGEHRVLKSDELAGALGVKKVDSQALGRLKRNNLVEVGKDGRVNTYALSSAGWRRATEVMGAPVEGRGSAARALIALLGALHRGFGQTGLDPEEFFKHGTGSASADAETLIRTAYHDLARVDGEWVSLADIRDRLAGLDPGHVDEALVALARADRNVKLIPWDNQKALTERERSAAVRYGGADAHMLGIGSA